MKKILFSACMFLTALSVPLQGAEKVRFVVYSDLHHDLIPSRPEALRKIVGAAEREKADFLIDLGDLAFPLPQNRVIADILDSAAVPVCHVLGNHDMDRSDKKAYMDFFGMETPHYCFDRAGSGLSCWTPTFSSIKRGTSTRMRMRTISGRRCGNM